MTGGAGGFGGAVVARLLAEGVRVIVVDQVKPATSHRGDLLSTDITCWNRVLTVNLTGTMLACQAAVPAMGRRGGGAIVNLGAVHTFRDAPDQPAYTISKSAVVALTRALAASLAGRRIRVNCVQPGAGPSACPDKEVADAVLDLLCPTAPAGGQARSPLSAATVRGATHPAAP